MINNDSVESIKTILSELVRLTNKESDLYWNLGNCKFSRNLSVMADVFSIVAKDMPDLRISTPEEMEDYLDRIRNEIGDILV